jgi:SAM-dependent methyltransferase
MTAMLQQDSDANNLYREQWDRYAKMWSPKNIAGNASDLNWPGDEWGDEQQWLKVFQTMFVNFGAQEWTECVEIGPGSGKYTNYLLRQSAAHITAFDISSAYLEIMKTRLADDVAGGRVDPVVLIGQCPSEILDHLRSQGLIRQLDAFYSIDAMVHVDLQYLMAYFLSAALSLKENGHLIMTLANAISSGGFKSLVAGAKTFYPLQGKPSGKFEWLSPEMVIGILTRLGFSVQFVSPYPQGIEVLRDLHLVATLSDVAKADSFVDAL